MLMMSVKEYASDVNLTVEQILGLCNKLNITAKSEEDMLDDDAIIMLDNEIPNVTADEASDQEESTVNDAEEDYLEEELLTETTTETNNKQSKKKKGKLTPTKKVNKKNDFMKQRKEMYKHKDKLKSNTATIDENVVLYKEGMTVSELATALNISVGELIKKLMSLGLMMNLNQSIDFETAGIISSDIGKVLKREEATSEVTFEELEIVDDETELEDRPPVITIMGHVDHGKTTLLDTIRKTNVVSGEAGGITQAIGAYQITYQDKHLTFIDTPGHAAFTEMRARGASVTDIVIIIVAADDGVMPQTKEAIDHAKAAGVPIIVAVNKMDKPGANPERVLTEMAEAGIIPESWGGDTMFVNISAKTGMGIDDLLERILLISEVSELKANPNRYASGTVIESKIDKSLGVVSTLLIQNGTLRLGDAIVVGNYAGRVRTLKNDLNESLVSAGPSTPVTVTGLSESPSAGDKFMVFENEKKAKAIANERQLKAKATNNQPTKAVSLDDLFNRINDGAKEINIILKADVKGSEEAVRNSLLKLDVEGVNINIIRSSIGAITPSDIVLAAASDAIIIGFNIRPDNKTADYAKERNVDIRLYNIIYKLVEDMEAAMLGKLDPIFEEKVLGQAEVRKLFKFSKVGTIAGSMVTSGIIRRDAKARIIRDGVVIYDGAINTIAREKDQVKEVKQGIECGITIENFNDIKTGDIIEAYEIVETKR
ncbi:MAG: translation initiation factor IF-2 [Bacilli bacterium]|nr:translation initiation factor IF-2 [Bacilli bacterium]